MFCAELFGPVFLFRIIGALHRRESVIVCTFKAYFSTLFCRVMFCTVRNCSLMKNDFLMIISVQRTEINLECVYALDHKLRMMHCSEMLCYVQPYVLLFYIELPCSLESISIVFFLQVPMHHTEPVIRVSWTHADVLIGLNCVLYSMVLFLVVLYFSFQSDYLVFR